MNKKEYIETELVNNDFKLKVSKKINRLEMLSKRDGCEIKDYDVYIYSLKMRNLEILVIMELMFIAGLLVGAL